MRRFGRGIGVACFERLNGLLIRKTKFQKTRLVPLHDTAVAGLGRYLMYRQETRCSGDHLFVTEEGKALVYWRVHGVFRDLLKSAATRLQFEPWSPYQRVGNESGNTCWLWRPT